MAKRWHLDLVAYVGGATETAPTLPVRTYETFVGETEWLAELSPDEYLWFCMLVSQAEAA
jgi:hypothetical protein